MRPVASWMILGIIGYFAGVVTARLWPAWPRRSWHAKQDFKLDQILIHLAGLRAQGERAMAKLTEVQAALAALSTKADDLGTQITTVNTNITDAKSALDAEIARVEALIAAGSGAATEADLQGLLDNMTAVSGKLDTASTGAATAAETATAISSEAAGERP